MTDGIISFEAKTERKTFEKTLFLSLDYGTHQIRLLGAPKAIFTHYFPSQRSTVRCLGRDCPVCKNNKRIELENQNPSSVRGYNKPSKRHYINVLDRTAVKVCPKCGAESKKSLAGIFPQTCPKCNSFINDVPETISNKIKVANLNETVKDQLMSFQSTILDESKNPLGLANFDVILLVVQAGGRKNTTALPTQPPVTDKVEIADELLYDLDRAVVTLTEDELVVLMTGVSLKDIFAARRNEENSTEDTVSLEAIEDVEKSIETLFSDAE